MKKIIFALLIAFSITLTTTKPVYAAQEVPVYQLYLKATKEHLYTVDTIERDQLVKNGWICEGIAWYAPSYSAYPVYRFYQKSTDSKYYTMDEEVMKKLIQNGYYKEGVSWYSSENEAVAIFENEKLNGSRTICNLSAYSGEYHYLAQQNWKRNGIYCYGIRKATEQESLDSIRTLPYTNNSCFYVDGILVVNKRHGLGSSYAPGEDPTAGAAIRRIIKDMNAAGYNIHPTYYSGYRSYSTQSTLYNNYVRSDGKANADRYSARPGFSEHQTGLAFDLCNKAGQLVESTREVNWIAANAHRYGFIVRYPYGKEHITGYMPEPWHLRYLGVETATKVYNSGLTLEEYLGVSYGDYE